MVSITVPSISSASPLGISALPGEERHLVAVPSVAARAVAAAALLETTRAIDRLVATGLEGNLSLLAAAGARCGEHLARRAFAPTVRRRRVVATIRRSAASVTLGLALRTTL